MGTSKKGGNKTSTPNKSGFAGIAERIDACCSEHLDDEYRKLCLDIFEQLAAMDSSPLASGKAEGWACGIVYAVGSHNFLWDKNHEPYMSTDDLCAFFGISKSTAQTRAAMVRDICGLDTFSLGSFREEFIQKMPLVWIRDIEGLLLDVRELPEFYQDELYKGGEIPLPPHQRLIASLATELPFPMYPHPELVDEVNEEHGLQIKSDQPVDITWIGFRDELDGVAAIFQLSKEHGALALLIDFLPHPDTPHKEEIALYCKRKMKSYALEELLDARAAEREKGRR